MKIVYDKRARDDLKQLADYLVRWNFSLKIIDQIRRKIKILADFPELGAVYRGGIRKITVLKRNAIYYEISVGVIHIRHIRSGRRQK